MQWGKDQLIPKGQILHCEDATTLEFERGTNSPYLVIHGDLGRAHYPQPWAKGVLPIVSMARFRASFLRFKMPGERIQRSHLALDYMLLLMHGWKLSLAGEARTWGAFLKLLRGVGFKLTVEPESDPWESYM